MILGDFSPRLFQPAWFAAQELVGAQEAEKATISIIHPDIVVFSLSWIRLEVTQERFLVLSEQQPYFKLLRDLVLGTFAILNHTPLAALGINQSVHYPVTDVKRWTDVQRQLAPDKVWNSIMHAPQLQSINMRGERSDERKGYVGVRVEPSQKVKPGIFVEANDHYEVAERGKSVGAEGVLAIIRERWDDSMLASENIINKIIEGVPARAG